MDLNYDDKKTVFCITAEDVQDVAVDMIKRRLTECEMHTAEKCIESGLSFGIETVFEAAIEEAIRK